MFFPFNIGNKVCFEYKFNERVYYVNGTGLNIFNYIFIMLSCTKYNLDIWAVSEKKLNF